MASSSSTTSVPETTPTASTPPNQQPDTGNMKKIIAANPFRGPLPEHSSFKYGDTWFMVSIVKNPQRGWIGFTDCFELAALFAARTMFYEAGTADKEKTPIIVTGSSDNDLLEQAKKIYSKDGYTYGYMWLPIWHDVTNEKLLHGRLTMNLFHLACELQLFDTLVKHIGPTMPNGKFEAWMVTASVENPNTVRGWVESFELARLFEYRTMIIGPERYSIRAYEVEKMDNPGKTEEMIHELIGNDKSDQPSLPEKTEAEMSMVWSISLRDEARKENMLGVIPKEAWLRGGLGLEGIWEI